MIIKKVRIGVERHRDIMGIGHVELRADFFFIYLFKASIMGLSMGAPLRNMEQSML